MTSLDELMQEFRTLANRAHVLGLTVIVVASEHDAKEDEESWTYTSAGSKYTVLGLLDQAHHVILNTGSES